MKKLAKLTAASLATVMLATACGDSGETTTTEGSGTTTETTDTASGDNGTLRVFGWNAFGDEDPDGLAERNEGQQAWYKEKLGVDYEFFVPTDDYDKQLASTLASGEKYDLIYFQSGPYGNFVEQGALTDLTPYIEASPILSDPNYLPTEYLDALRQPDGKIYALPTKIDGGLVATVRKDWLDEFGMEVPTTLEDWEAYWAAAKEQKGAMGLSTRVLYDIQPWASGFGLTQGLDLADDGSINVSYASDASIDMWKWFNEMYTKGYFDPNFETNSSGDFRNAMMAGQVASVSYWQHWIGTFEEKVQADETNTQKETFDVVAAPPVMKDGKGSTTFGELPLLGVPANAEHPENAIAFFELWYSEEGTFASIVGLEGYDYNMTADGKVELTELGKKHNLNHQGAEPINPNWVYPEELGGDPRGEDELAAWDMVMEYGHSSYTPSNYDELMSVIEKYGSMAIKGSIPAEEAVANMQKDITALGAQKNQTITFN